MIGEIVSHYKIEERLGGGGMGIVYRAKDLKLDRNVALKFLPPALSMDEEYKQVIINEAKIAATLDHPNICTIYEVGETEDEQIFIAMAYYEGETLKKKISQNSIAEEELESIVLQIAKGLEHAHKNGIIHRDIKPANIFVTEHSEVKILDFGIAKLEGDYSVLDAEKVKGTISYMSPEQLTGKKVDIRTDIWAYGVLLFELATGKKPFGGDLEQTAIYSILNEEPDLTEETINKYQYRKLLNNCLQKDPDKRYQSFNDVISILDINVKSKGRINKKKVSNLIVGIFAGIIFIILLINLIPKIISYFEYKELSSNRIAVLPFEYNYKKNEEIQTPEILQSIIVSNLTHYQQFSLVDPLSLNGMLKSGYSFSSLSSNKSLEDKFKDLSINYYLHGSIILENDKRIFNTNFIDVSSAKVVFTENIIDKNGTNLINIGNDISRKILDYFHVKTTKSGSDKDVKPFTQGTKSITALKSFLIASDCNYRFDKIEEEKYLKQAIYYDSTFISPRIWLIPTLRNHNKIEEAEEQLKILKDLELKANRFERNLIYWAEAYMDNDVPDQIQYLNLALEASPKNNIILYNLAYLYYSQENYDESIKMIQQTIDMKWECSGAYYLLGFCLLKLDKYKQTIKILTESLTIKPFIDEINLLLGISFLKENEFNKAVYYDSLYFSNLSAQAIPPKISHEYAALIYGEFNVWNKSIENYKKVIGLDPKNTRVRVLLGDCYLKIADTSSSINEYKNILEYDTTCISANLKLAEIYESKKEMNSAINYYQAVLKMDSTGEYGHLLNKINKLNKN